MSRHLRWVAAAATMLLLVPFSAFAHAVVSPAASRAGAYERYVLRVPNETDVATVRVEMRFPPDVRVISFVDVPGWKLEAAMDSTGRAISAVWTGSLPPERFVELPFMAVNPTSAARIEWPVIQTYADGERVEWTGPRGSDRPASVTEISGSRFGLSLATTLSALAVLVSLGALTIALRARRAA